MTKMKGQEPIHWKLFEVKPPERAVTEMQLADAVVRFAWTYDELPGGGRRMIQQISLEGPGAAAYVPLMGQHFAPNVPTGMERLVREIEKAAAEQPASPAHQ